MSAAIQEMLEDSVGALFDEYALPNSLPRDWNLDGMQEALRRDFNLELDLKGWLEADPEIEQNLLRARVLEASRSAYQQKVERIGAPIMRHIERDVVLRTLDQHWRDHLAAMDYLRQGIHLRGYAQKDYRFEYKREAFELFSAMLGRVKFDTVSTLAKVEVRTQEQIDREEAERREKLMRALQARHAEAQSLLGAPEPDVPAAAGAGPTLAGGAASSLLAPSGGANPAEAVAPFVRSDRKVGRNEPCPCGSGRKYKHCHGALAGSQ
jgi:preprotein translocase subunit SecA